MECLANGTSFLAITVYKIAGSLPPSRQDPTLEQNLQGRTFKKRGTEAVRL